MRPGSGRKMSSGTQPCRYPAAAPPAPIPYLLRMAHHDVRATHAVRSLLRGQCQRLFPSHGTAAEPRQSDAVSSRPPKPPLSPVTKSPPRSLLIPARKKAPAPLRTYGTPHTPRIAAYPRRRPGSALPCTRPRGCPERAKSCSRSEVTAVLSRPVSRLASLTHAAVKRIPCPIRPTFTPRPDS